ncbi:hypothetical protein F4814DRAFT_445035 [Daldinia grandis]|nr:hypothetical protein F4814DRAFT_445035 [Daldinia grandis]
MDKSSYTAINGSAKSGEDSFNFQRTQDQHSTLSIHKYTTGVLNGDAPVNSLIGLRDTELNITPRNVKVNREVEDALAKLAQRPNQYVSFRLCPILLRAMCRISHVIDTQICR